MPWSHCDVPFILDDEPCPECGADKETWTVELSDTRVMQVARKRAALVLELVDVEGTPIPEADYCCELDRGHPREGVLDGEGRATVRNLVPGPCWIQFPAHGVEERIDLDAEFCAGNEEALHSFTADLQRICVRLERLVCEGHAATAPLANVEAKLTSLAVDEAEPIRARTDGEGHLDVAEATPGAFWVEVSDEGTLLSGELETTELEEERDRVLLLPAPAEASENAATEDADMAYDDDDDVELGAAADLEEEYAAFAEDYEGLEDEDADDA